jgi:hypothetical protein
MHNPMIIYAVLGLYGVLILLVIGYVYTKFRTAGKTLQMLQSEWQSAESTHANFVGIAQERLSKLSKPAPAAATPLRSGGVAADMRHQVVMMAKRGSALNDIARTCGLHEGEVDVLLGMARLQR